MTLDEFKAKLIYGCRKYYQSAIYERYQPHTQINIVAGIEGDLEEFKAYIQDKQSSFAVIKTAVAKLEETSLKGSFQVGTNESMKEHVSTFLKELDGEDQKLAVVMALQEIM